MMTQFIYKSIVYKLFYKNQKTDLVLGAKIKQPFPEQKVRIAVLFYNQKLALLVFYKEMLLYINFIINPLAQLNTFKYYFYI